MQQQRQRVRACGRVGGLPIRQLMYRFCKALVLATFCIVATFAIGVPKGHAAVRFAAPEGDGQSPCLRLDPCSLFLASSLDAPKDEQAENGDEVVVLPGEYSGAAGDLGPQERLSLPVEVDVRGESEHGRPVISSASKSSVVILNGHSMVSDLEIIGPNASNPLRMSQSTAQRIVVRTSREGSIACHLGFRSVLRDSACISSGKQGVGAGQQAGTNPFPGNTRLLRNVTAIGTGPESIGLLFDISGGEVQVDAKSTIAQGTAVDVEAIGSEPEGIVLVFLEASSFTTTRTEVRDDGIALVGKPGSGENITEPPLLAADGFHQLPGSPTIDKGIVGELSGSLDIDRNARVVRERPDIGADEMLIPTSTGIVCSPVILKFGQESTCTATVETAEASVPAGSVAFAAESTGRRTELGTCNLAASGSNHASCEFTFPIMIVDPNLQLAASYSGDSSHTTSHKALQLSASANRTATTVTCSPTAAVIGRSTTCTAIVSNLDTDSVDPSGEVLFEGTWVGVFSPLSSCMLAQTGGAQSSCQIAYVPHAVGNGVHSIFASYFGDEGYEASSSSIFSLSVFTAPVKSRHPNTVLKRKPQRRTARHRATMTFASDQPKSSFQCKLDRKAYRPCRSPFSTRVTVGWHIFRVRAVGSAGPDATPAMFRWKVLPWDRRLACRTDACLAG